MPRIARRKMKSNYYHVIVQGINKEYIFDKEKYILEYKEIVLKKLENAQINILAYCIMNNHAHFLIYSKDIENVSKYMQRINTTYSQFYNREKKRVGYVFRSRFYTEEILDKNQLYTCVKYIHNNPVKAKMVKEAKDYKHSSYNEFLGNRYIINDESVEVLFDSRSKFIEKYHQIHKEESESLYEFVDIKEKEIQEYIREVEKEYNMNAQDMRKDKKILRKVIKNARKETDVTVRELAEILGISKSIIGNYEK